MYERFFMVEPSKHMTKPQFISGVKKVFGSHITKSDKPLELLFESFDGQHMDKMEWRLFVCLLTLVMQPGLSNEAFVAKAPAAVVNKDRERAAELQTTLQTLQKQIEALANA